jgi:transposase
MTMMHQQRTLRYLGLDVHKASISVAIAEESGPPTTYGRIPNEPATIRTVMTRLGGPGIELRVAYEAGPTGYALHRQLTRLGIACMVVAPSLIPRQPGNKVKTDRRDALKLARLLRSGDLTPVWVPDEAHEALRSLVRARADAKADQLRAKHRLSKFLLRHGCWPPIGVRSWSKRYFTWLHQLAFEHLPDRIVFADYLAEVNAAGERITRLERALHECAQSSSQVALIRGLQAFRGIGFLSAVTLAAEAGDLRRFRTAPQFMAYAGIVPSESSSADKHQRGPITKTGNRLLRHVLGEAAHHARHAPRVTSKVKQRQADVPPEMIDLAWRAQVRLHARYRHLSARIGSLKALVAIARELAGFIWAAGHVLQEEVPAAA